MGSNFAPSPVANAPAQVKSSRFAAFFQILAIVVCVPATAWGIFWVVESIHPPPCGDWSGLSGLGVLECWATNLPVALVTLAISAFVKRGSPLLRTSCLICGTLVLILPIAATFALGHHHCP